MAAPPRKDPWDDALADLRAGLPKPVYLFHGGEPWLVEQARRATVEATLPGGPRGFNRDEFQGGEATADAVAAAVRTLPMMAKHRLVIVKEADGLKGDAKALLAWIKDPAGNEARKGAGREARKDGEDRPPTAVLVMSAGKLGKDGLGPQLSRAVAKTGASIEFKPLYDRQVLDWIRQEVQRRGKRISHDGVRFLLDMCGANLGQLAGEITKVCLYVGERPDLAVEDLETVVADLRMSTVFDLVDALGARDLAGAVLAIDRAFLQDRDPALPMLAMLARHYRQTMILRQELQAGVPEEQACAAAGLNPKLAWKTAPVARRFGPEELRRALVHVDRAEQTIKSSRLEGRLVLERLAMELCGSAGQGKARSPGSPRA